MSRNIPDLIRRYENNMLDPHRGQMYFDVGSGVLCLKCVLYEDSIIQQLKDLDTLGPRRISWDSAAARLYQYRGEPAKILAILYNYGFDKIVAKNEFERLFKDSPDLAINHTDLFSL